MSLCTMIARVLVEVICVLAVLCSGEAQISINRCKLSRLRKLQSGDVDL